MTPDEGLRKQIEAYQRMRPELRVRIAFELYDMARALAGDQGAVLAPSLHQATTE